MLDRSEWPELTNDLAQYVLEALTADEANSDGEYQYLDAAAALARATAAAYHFAAVLLQVDSWQRTYAQAVFLKLAGTDEDSFRIIMAEEALIPGGIGNTFNAIDEWYNQLEKTVMPERARALLQSHGEAVNPETKQHWEAIASKRKGS